MEGLAQQTETLSPCPWTGFPVAGTLGDPAVPSARQTAPWPAATNPTGSLSINSGRTVTVTRPETDVGREEQLWGHWQRGWDGQDTDGV